MSQEAPAHSLGRRRRANVAGGRQHSHRVLVSPEEEARLVALAEAQHVTVPRLLVESTLSATVETPAQRRQAMAELFALRRLLAALASDAGHTPEVLRLAGRIEEAVDALAAT